MESPDNFPLHSAAKSNDLESAELILSERIDIYCKDDIGLTAFDILIQKKIELFDTLHDKERELLYSIIKPTNEEALSEGSLRYIDEKNQEHQEKFAKEKEYLFNNIYKNDRFVSLLLNHKTIDNSCLYDTLLKLHAACTLKETPIADNLSNQVGDIEQFIRKDSPIYPGYTALHFAAHCNIETVKMLVTKGANLITPDAEGVTPLDICTKWFSLEEMQSILSLEPEWKNILFSNGKTKLMDYISSLNNPGEHKIFLQNLDKDVGVTLSNNSPLWPGFTILHVAVSLITEVNLEIFKDILKYNTNIITVQDCCGSTPVHLAFRYNKLWIIDLLLKHHKKAVNPLDKDDLSHLHIAVAVNRQPLVKNILKSERNFNIAYKGKPLSTVKPGWTPLHTAACTNHAVVAKLLLEQGANLLQTDSQGFTAVHLLVYPNATSKLAEVLFSSNQLKECKVEGIGLTHLHAAVWKNDTKTIERLVNLGADLEATIGKVENKHLKKFEGFRPIHMAMVDSRRLNAFAVLLKLGADIFEKKLGGPSPLQELLTGKYNEFLLKSFLSFFCSNEKLQNRLKKEFGMTILHLACYIFDRKMVQELLEKKVDVNARIRDDSSIWPGFTPLHVLLAAGLIMEHDRTSQLNVDKLCDALLNHEADVTVANAEGDTPVIMSLKIRHTVIGRIRANLLLSHQRNFSLNPTAESGMSHFHVACLLCKVETAEEFLKNISHIDVNQVIKSSDNSEFAGRTPLLLALTKRSYNPEAQVKMVNLLLERGAHVHAVDTFGYTPLHKLCSCTRTRKDLLDKILIDNIDINKQAIDGKTPMEILLRNGASSKEVQYFVERGAVINDYNPVSDVGYMAIVVNNDKLFENSPRLVEIIQIMKSLPDIGVASATGRNAIHNAVAAENSQNNYLLRSNLIDQLINLGCNIFQQDSQGRTALHLAVKFRNDNAVLGLLSSGADVNIVDLAGKSPLAYAAEFPKDKRHWVSQDSGAVVCTILAVHVKKLQLIGLQVSEQNAELLKILDKRGDIDFKSLERVIKQELEHAAKLKMCQRGFTLRDFLCQTGVVNSYSSLKEVDRKAVDSFSRSLWFSELTSFFKLQYRFAVERPSLIEPAKDELRRLLGFPLPDLCAEIVLTYLTNFDIKNMTAAMTIADANCTSMAVD